MDPAAAAMRAEWTRERTWTGPRVCEAICTAWRAHPRTEEHTEIMAWPSLYLPLDHDARLATHMMGLNCQSPEHRLTTLVHKRLGWKSYHKYLRARDRACGTIAAKLNEGVEPLVIVARRAA